MVANQISLGLNLLKYRILRHKSFKEVPQKRQVCGKHLNVCPEQQTFKINYFYRSIFTTVSMRLNFDLPLHSFNLISQYI